MSLTTKVLIALLAGLGLGIGAASSQSAVLLTTVGWIEPVGTLFINSIRMTIIPLVVSSLIVGITAAPDTRTIGRLGGRALLFMLVAMTVASTIGVLAAGPAFAWLPIDPAATEALRASAGDAASAAADSAKKLPSMAQWLVDLVPANPIKAAADGAMLPLIIFSVAFGIALTRVAEVRQTAVVRLFEGIQDTSITLVRWVLELAPIGVFGLAAPLGLATGLSLALATGLDLPALG